MSDMNRILLEGNLGGDPIIRYTKSGQAVANFSLANNRYFKDKEGKLQKVTTWGRCVVWGKKAEATAKMCVKGTKVRIEAQLRNGSYTNSEGKVVRYDEFRVDDIRFLGNTKNKQSEDTVPEVIDEQPEDMLSEEPVQEPDTRDLVF